jgi:hypothetical protein
MTHLESALSDPLWQSHQIGNLYHMKNAGKVGDNGWKIAYYPLFGTYKGPEGQKQYVEFDEPRALVEKQVAGGFDFREVPLRFLTPMS